MTRALPQLIALAAALMLTAPGQAQSGASEPTATPVSSGDASTNQIIVTAQRSGAPMWTIETPTGAIILVGEIRAVPKSTPWQPDRLKEATAEAQRVIIRARPKFSPGDFLRLIFRGGRFIKLPDKTVASDYLDPAQRARLAALEATYDKDYSRGSFLITAFDLLSRRLDFDDETTDDATDVVRKAAGKADVPIDRPARFRGEDLLDNLSEAEPASHIPCLEAAMTATEIGAELIDQRGEDWRSFDVPAVMANPLEIALGTCWPWADPELGSELRTIWTEAITGVSEAEGVSVAVVPLRVLAETGGVLDQLENQGFEIGGPAWR